MEYRHGRTNSLKRGSIGIANLNGSNEYVLIAEGSIREKNIAIALIDAGPVTINANIAPLVLEGVYIEPTISPESLVFDTPGRPRGALILAAESLDLVFWDRGEERFVSLGSGAVVDHHYIDAPHTIEWRIMARNEDGTSTEMRRFRFSA